VSELVWGVKESFRNYVAGAGGEVAGSVAGPAPYRFPAGPGELRFTGEVAFAAHGGMMSVRIVDPAVEVTPQQTYLTVVDPDHLPRTEHRIRIARLGPVVGGAPLTAVPAKLTVHGSMLFGGVYPVGAELDPVTARDP
jgi:hypothetical protein